MSMVRMKLPCHNSFVTVPAGGNKTIPEPSQDLRSSHDEIASRRVPGPLRGSSNSHISRPVARALTPAAYP
jgi:hypothetical protein